MGSQNGFDNRSHVALDLLLRQDSSGAVDFEELLNGARKAWSFMEPRGQWEA